MASPTVEQAWDHYGQLRARYRRQKTPRYSAAERTQKQLELADYLRWCEVKGLPALLFMDKRFEALYQGSRKCSIPRIGQLKSEKLAALWVRVESDHYRDQQATRLHQAMADPKRQEIRELGSDLVAHQETVKRKNSANPDGCLALFRFSGGYHPKSGWCQQCVNQGVCARQLQATYGFDVVALRLGRYQGLPNRVLHAALG